MVKEETKKLPINTLRSDTFKNINVSGFFGGHRPGYFEAVIYSDEMDAGKALQTQPPDSEKIEINRILECRLLMDPFQAKSVLEWLQKHVEDYEKIFGEIKVNQTKKEVEGEDPYKFL
jgi:hypothetical protein